MKFFKASVAIVARRMEKKFVSCLRLTNKPTDGISMSWDSKTCNRPATLLLSNFSPVMPSLLGSRQLLAMFFLSAKQAAGTVNSANLPDDVVSSISHEQYRICPELNNVKVMQQFLLGSQAQ